MEKDWQMVLSFLDKETEEAKQRNELAQNDINIKSLSHIKHFKRGRFSGRSKFFEQGGFANV